MYLFLLILFFVINYYVFIFIARIVNDFSQTMEENCGGIFKYIFY